MAKADKRRQHVRLPEQVVHALRAAEDKKAIDVVVLDLRKAAGFTDFTPSAQPFMSRMTSGIGNEPMKPRVLLLVIFPDRMPPT